jgi:hypothetical protein
MSAAELDEAFRTAVTGDGPDGGWTIKNDERVKYVGKLEVQKGEDTTLKVRAHTAFPEAETRGAFVECLALTHMRLPIPAGDDGGLP